MIKQIFAQLAKHKAGIAIGAAMVMVPVCCHLYSKDHKKYEEEKDKLPDDASTKDKVFCAAKNHWRTGIAILSTETLMFLSHRAMVKELAGATAAIAIAMAKKDEIDNYFRTNYPKEYKAFRESVNKENIEKIFMDNPKILKKEETYDGRQRYYDPWSCQVFFATEAQVLEAECFVNEQVINTGVATLFDYLATFPSSSGIVLEDWMKHFGWYEGDTSYTYSAGYFGSYLKPQISCQDIVFKGDTIEVNCIWWQINPDLDPDLSVSEIVEVEKALEESAA